MTPTETDLNSNAHAIAGIGGSPNPRPRLGVSYGRQCVDDAPAACRMVVPSLYRCFQKYSGRFWDDVLGVNFATLAQIITYIKTLIVFPRVLSVFPLLCREGNGLLTKKLGWMTPAMGSLVDESLNMEQGERS